MDSSLSIKPAIEGFFDPATWTISYVVYDADGGTCALIDSVQDYDPKSGRTATASAEKLVGFVRAHRLKVEWVLETHAHADHLSAAQYLRERLGGRIAIGEHIRTVQRVFKKLYNLEPGFPVDGSQFDQLFSDGGTFRIGQLTAEAMHVPGHTPADMAYRIGDAVFVGDTMFMPDVGSARADFPGGDAHALYRSARKLLSLPGDTRLFMCHDYPPKGREASWETSVAAERESNIHLRDGVSEEQFVAMRTARDRTLEMPTLILPSIQVNIRAGKLPPPEANGISYLKVPVNAL